MNLIIAATVAVVSTLSAIGVAHHTGKGIASTPHQMELAKVMNETK